ncbi:hypothetical protein PanWU01x14_295150, partial [Parasponia andersonii]
QHENSIYLNHQNFDWSSEKLPNMCKSRNVPPI